MTIFNNFNLNEKKNFRLYLDFCFFFIMFLNLKTLKNFNVLVYPKRVFIFNMSIKLFYRILLCPLLCFLSLYGLLTVYLTPINKYDF